MQMLRILMLLVALAIGYLLFFNSQSKPTDLPPDLTRPAAPGTFTAAHPAAARTQYKEAMNRAQAVANQMQAERKEADSY